jgi:predicted P-loop ATPase
VRRPYGRMHEMLKRTVVICGTTNDKGWHHDATGGRRFWPIDVEGKVDLAWLEANVDQLWAEALSRYVAGEAWHDVPADEHAAMIDEHYSEDPRSERIAAWLQREGLYTRESAVEAIAGDPNAHDERGHWGTLITTSRIMTQCLQIPLERQFRNLSNPIAQIMRKVNGLNGL